MRTRTATAILAALLIMAGSLGSAQAAGTGARKAVIDCFGRSIPVAEPADRVIPIFYVMAEYLCAVGARGKIVGIGSVYAKDAILDRYCPGIYSLPVVAKGGLNLERLVELKPDLVLCSNSSKMVESIEGVGVAAFASMPRVNADVFAQIRDVGTLVGKEAEASAVALYLEARVAEVTSALAGLADAERPSVYYLRDQPLQTMGKGVISDIIGIAGGRNVAEGLGESGSPVMVSMENVLAWNPRVIILRDRSAVTPEQLYADPLWAGVDAVKDRRVYRESYGWTEFRTETAFGIMEKAKWLQAERCAGLDPAKAHEGFFALIDGFYR